MLIRISKNLLIISLETDATASVKMVKPVKENIQKGGNYDYKSD